MEADPAAQGKSIDDLVWAVPYLPVDPKDLGRTYEAVIRVNSQSGKGGVAYLLKTDHALDLPRMLQIEFSAVVQAKTDAEGGEVSSEQIWQIFSAEYLPSTVPDEKWGRLELRSTRTASDVRGEVALHAELRVGDDTVAADGTGAGPVAAFLGVLRAQGIEVQVCDYVERAMGTGGDAIAAAYVECQV